MKPVTRTADGIILGNSAARIECRMVFTCHADRSVLEIEWQISNHAGTTPPTDPCL